MEEGFAGRAVVTKSPQRLAEVRPDRGCEAPQLYVASGRLTKALEASSSLLKVAAGQAGLGPQQPNLRFGKAGREANRLVKVTRCTSGPCRCQLDQRDRCVDVGSAVLRIRLAEVLLKSVIEQLNRFVEAAFLRRR